MAQKLMQFDLKSWCVAQGQDPLKLADMFGLSRATIYRFMRNGAVPVIVLFALKGVEKMATQQQEAA